MRTLHKDRVHQAAQALRDGVDKELVAQQYGYDVYTPYRTAREVDSIPVYDCEGCGKEIVYRTTYYIEDYRFCRCCREKLFIEGTDIRARFSHLFAED